MSADIGALIAAISPATRIAILINPKQAAALSFAVAVPSFITMVSASVAAGRVIAVDLDSLLAASWGPPNFEVTNSATIHEDDVPLPLGTPGAPGDGRGTDALAVPDRCRRGPADLAPLLGDDAQHRGGGGRSGCVVSAMVQDDDDPDDEARQILEREMAERQSGGSSTPRRWNGASGVTRRAMPFLSTDTNARLGALPSLPTMARRGQHGARGNSPSAIACTESTSPTSPRACGTNFANVMPRSPSFVPELRELRNEIAVAKRLDEITNRLNGLETAPRLRQACARCEAAAARKMARGPPPFLQDVV